jgi:hypothetical protein
LGGVIDGKADEDILASLISLDVEENDDYKTGMRIIMEFGPNEYFTATKVTREYAVTTDGAEPTVTITPKLKWTKPGVCYLIIITLLTISSCAFVRDLPHLWVDWLVGSSLIDLIVC